jgi:4-amino-4-deoxy-L-arabinose transferase-like glycosyltransferase
MPAPPHARTDLAILVVLALLTNFAYLWGTNDYYFPDSETYIAPALQLLHGHGFLTDDGVIETLRTPGYPLFLLPFVALTKSAVPIVVVQHLFNALLAAAIYLLARRRTSRFVALLAGVFFAIDPTTVHNANKVLTENLFTLVLFALFALVLRVAESKRTRDLVIAAVLAGALVLIRPVAIAFFAVIALFLIRRIEWRRIAVFVAIAASIPCGWAARNAYHTGVFTISSIAGANMILYRAAGAIAMENDGEFKDELAIEQRQLVDAADAEIEDAMHIPDAEELPHAEASREYGRIARRTILEHPRGAVMVTLRGVLVNLFDSDWDSIMVVSIVDSSTVQLAIDAWTVVIFVFAVIGFFALWQRDRTLALLAGLTIGYFIVISAGGEAEARFRVPIVPQYAIVAAAGVEAAIRGIRSSASLAPR